MSIRAKKGKYRRTLVGKAAGGAVATGLALSALVGGPASAAPVASANFVTPIHGMQCSTTAGDSSGSGTCTGAGKWRVVVSCSWGLTYSSVWLVNWPGQTQTATAGSCWWGVNSVTIEETTN